MRDGSRRFFLRQISLGFWVLGSGFWVLGSGFWVQRNALKHTALRQRSTKRDTPLQKKFRCDLAAVEAARFRSIKTPCPFAECSAVTHRKRVAATKKRPAAWQSTHERPNSFPRNALVKLLGLPASRRSRHKVERPSSFFQFSTRLGRCKGRVKSCPRQCSFQYRACSGYPPS